MFKTQEERIRGKREVLFNANRLRHLVVHAKEHGVKFAITSYRNSRVFCKMQLLNKIMKYHYLVY